MTKTNWKIRQSYKGYECYLNNKFQSICLDEESALHSIWVMSKSTKKDFYVLDGENVYLREKIVEKVEK